VEKLIAFRYQGLKRVKVIGARFGIDREKKRKPFGYVEFETPEEVSYFAFFFSLFLFYFYTLKLTPLLLLSLCICAT
jgi:RNA recognition motif-containing protein